MTRDGHRTAYANDDAGQLTSAGRTRFEYDDIGNQIARIEDQERTQYRYNSDNQLTAVELPNGKSVRFGYAPTGERVWREDDTGRTYYVTDGLHVWAELDGQLQATSLYAHGPQLDGPLMLTRGAQSYCYHADALGSVTALSDGAGKLAQRYRYDAFGNPQSARRGRVDSPVRFTGREWDRDLQLYYFPRGTTIPRQGVFSPPIQRR